MNASASTAHTPKQVRPRLRAAGASTLAGQAGNVPLTRVALAYIEPRFKLYLRFGEPARTLQLDRWRRCAVFLPNAVLCRIRWQANDYGTIRWQLMVMQTATPLDAVQRIPGVQPGARLLHAEGDANVRAVLERIDGIEALGIAAADTSPAYWRTLANRLAALGATHTPQNGTPPGWPGGHCHDHDFHDRPRAASSLAPALASCWQASPPSASLRWPGRRSCSPAANGLQPVRQRGGRLVSHRTVRPAHRLAATSAVRGQHRADAAARQGRHAGCAARLPADPRSAAQTCGRSRATTRCIVAGQVRIDGVPVAAALPADRLGRPLPSLQLCRRLQPGELFLLSATNPASFDSRYFGPVSAFAVIGVAHPIWLETRP